jgi:hypothetical protein
MCNTTGRRVEGKAAQRVHEVVQALAKGRLVEAKEAQRVHEVVQVLCKSRGRALDALQ